MVDVNPGCIKFQNFIIFDRPSANSSTVTAIFVRYIALILLSVVIFSCNENRAKANSESADTSAIEKDSALNNASVDSDSHVGAFLYVWSIDYEKKTKTRNPDFSNDLLNVDSVIKGLNQLYPEIQMSKIGLFHDTLFSEIKDSEYLTERIGTYGAEAYIADVVINLTAIKKINFVKIQFEAGSHLSPGVWDKRDFDNYKELE